MTKKPIKKESETDKKIRLLENKIKKMDKTIKELERKINHVYDIDSSPIKDQDVLNKPAVQP